MPAEPQAAPTPAPALPERTCDQLQDDAATLINTHNACTADADCAAAAAGCPNGFACGVAVRAGDLAHVDAEMASISDRYKTQCKHCARERVRCMKLNPVCNDGHCAHAPDQAVCDRLDQEAEALVQKHNACASDADCVFARGSGGCPEAFACGVSVNKDQEKAFVELAAPLSKTFYEYCDRCTSQTAECVAATPVCSEGRCSRKR
ncbi:MAG TPA: hypothetical protein VFG30_00610 [Polyangiales bacterium]|nr:hypothetical protein [Polyangiales bacterium]